VRVRNWTEVYMYQAESFRLRIEYRTLNILGEIYLVLSSLMRKVQLRQQDLDSTAPQRGIKETVPREIFGIFFMSKSNLEPVSIT
jgi:hypothetical protein